MQSRYYDPTVGRFINSDGQLNGGFLGNNLFAYCENNPVMGYDPTGTFNWKALRQLGEECVKVGFAAICVAGAIATIGTAVAGTAASGGAVAVAIPAAMVLSVKCLALAGAAVASVGVGLGIVGVAGETGENISYSKDFSSSGRISNAEKQESEMFNSFERVKGKSYRTSGKGRNKRYYDWDYTHNDIEVYDKNGNHLGSMDPKTGEMYKDPVKGRKLW